ncbi:Putative aliphatic sulfonates transport permease protein SsuC [Labrenzia sp. THAF82]|uniref:ABC transporter permease n=1 Tax=Labrenzia sp. THAF82 TaxID=2587861 RepID=UPI0012679207|nr:ABC transporter permease subunit [Labrenzia sp. THAF82]QFT31299.1 Putative aliphatic sulfonates transport permease protein SsuC [Labrenzia sp. THAF82]
MLRNLAMRLLDRVGRVLDFLWSGWAGLAALCLLAAAWQIGHEAYGPFILTSPLETLQAIGKLAQDPDAWGIALLTLQRALTGFVLVALTGCLLGISAGYSPATMRIASPLITVILGVPPIAWIVLAMIWFGGSDATVRVVILVAALPVVFLGAASGISTRDRGLDRMAKAFGAGPIRRFLSVGLRQTTTTLFPALALALGTSFKVAVMAELLANAGGIGGALADARINLDIATALAWVVVAVGLLIVVEYSLIHPVKGEIDRWRRAAQPWGIKR